MENGTLEEAVVGEMRGYFGEDRRRIDHALAVLGYAKRLMARAGGDPGVVIPAAVLHDIGIHEAERRHGSPSGHWQQIEGPPIAQGILRALGVDAGTIDEVCEIIAHHHTPGVIRTRNFEVLYDADCLVNLPAEYGRSDADGLKRVADRIFLTREGRKLADEIYFIPWMEESCR